MALLAGCALTLAACGGGSSSQGPPLAAVGRQGMTLRFGDYQSNAELTYPETPGRHATVILVPGSLPPDLSAPQNFSGPEDLNADVCSPSGKPLSHIFEDIANYLSPRGYAVLRYDSHGVTGPCQGATVVTGQRQLQDAGVALQAAESDPKVDARRIFVYGWSEGSTVAASLVLRRPEVHGLVVQAPVFSPWAQIFDYQATDVGVAYLQSLAPDGRVTDQILQKAASGQGGPVARSILDYVAAPGSGPGAYAINPALDTNHDNTLEIDSELAPGLPKVVAQMLSSGGALDAYGPGQALPVLGDQGPKLTLPTLILQGENDSYVPPMGATDLDNALATPQKSLVLYPGLGNSLGRAASPVQDDYAPIANQPLVNLASWLNRHQG